jgi:Leucine-rich repeat (LRR) protein
MQRRIFLIVALLFPAPLAGESVDWIAALGGSAEYNAAGQIVEVNLRGSWISDVDMIELSRLPQLERLDLSHTRITDEGLLRLKSAPKIVDLNLFYTEQITDQGMTAVRAWHNLKRLNVRGTRISDGTLEMVSRMPQLEALDIANTQFTDDGLDYLITLVNLRELSLGGSRLSDKALETLRLLPTLTYLDLGSADGRRSSRRRGRSGMPDKTVLVIAGLQNLVTLKMGHSDISTRGVEILSRLQNVEKLALEGCSSVGDDAVASLAGWKSLKYLDLQDAGMSVAGVESLRRARPDLKILADPGSVPTERDSDSDAP